ncbi:MAG TPA: hypothetical protein VL418_07665 [Devosiaceae bacterium]|nr:hypothetical protein [Devosiaceae bacterium]
MDSTLYRLIAAGELAHQALLVPLVERGLEAGDDAVLFSLALRQGTTEAQLALDLGVAPESLARRIARLIDRDLVTRDATEPGFPCTLALTERGERIHSHLAETWTELENALLGELKKKRRARLGETLGRFVALLRL